MTVDHTRDDPPPWVLVAVPARDEADRITGCLVSVAAAVEAARADGVIAGGIVAVAAHRCTDDTAARSRSAVAPSDQLILVLRSDARDVGVGAVRTGLVQTALDEVTVVPRPAWVFSTDADTTVPVGWIIDGLRIAGGGGVGQPADVVVGLVDLDPTAWGDDAAVEQDTLDRHDEVVGAGIAADGTHRHAYAANLLIDLDVFLAVGGFPDVAHGEEHHLIRAVRALGGTVITTTQWRTVTSARLVGRAERGLSSVLRSLSTGPAPAR